MIFVTCKSDHIDFNGERVTNEDELREVVVKFAPTGSYMCSSSLDYPEDETDDPTLIYLCDLLRGNNVSGKNPEFAGLESLFPAPVPKVEIEFS